MSRLLLALVTLLALAPSGRAQPLPPELTGPINDFANVIDPGSRSAIERQIQALMQTTGDVVVLATVPTIEPYADIEEYALRMFENRGRGIGARGKENGTLIVLAVRERRIRVETGYETEQFITDGFAGETIRSMAPAFRENRYGEGLAFGVSRIVERIAQGRNVTINVPGVPQPSPRVALDRSPRMGFWFFLLILFILWTLRTNQRQRRRGGRWGRGQWSGWDSGVGPFGPSSGGFGGGFGGFGGGYGGFGGSGGGGFGGFGGGRSGGGGASGGW
jgi:uncharacterized protein